MNKISKIIIGIVVIIAIFVGYRAYQKPEQVTKDETRETIKIGALYALTGPAAKFGELSVQGAKDAIEYYKANGGKADVQLVIEDTQGDPKYAVSAATKMFNIDKIKFAIVGTSGVSAAIAPLADQYKSLVISDATLYGLTNGKTYMFQNFMPALNIVSKQINENAKWNKIAIVYINNEFGNSWSKIIGDQIDKNKTVQKLSFETNTTDFKTGALKVKQFAPDVAMVLGSGPALNQVYADMYLQGARPEIMSYLSCTLPGVLSDPRFSLENQYSYEYPKISSVGITKWMTDKQKDDKNAFYAIAFENTLVAINAAQKSNNDPEKAVSLLKNESFAGVFGDVKFDDKNMITRELFSTRIADGKCEFIKE